MGWFDIEQQWFFLKGDPAAPEDVSHVPPTPHLEKRTEAGTSARTSEEAVLDQPMQAGELSLQEATSGGLGRHLGLTSTTFLIVVRIIGTGIFSTPSSITQGVGSVGAAMMLWVLGLVLSYCGLMVWLELGCVCPRSGGEKVYLEAVYRRPKFSATVVFAIQAIALGFTAPGCIIFASNMVVAAGRNPRELEERGILPSS